MSELYDQPRQPEATSPAMYGPAVLPIDEAVSQHLSQVYWDWRATFDRDPQASPLQHADYVLTELATGRADAHIGAALIREDSSSHQSSLGVLVPKTIRTSQVGGIGPGWTMRGLRLAGGRFLSEITSSGQQRRMLDAATRYAADSGADFLVIEDLDEGTELFRAVQDQLSHGCRVFATHEFQPRRYVDFPTAEADYWKTFSSRSLSKFRRNLKKFGQTRLERVTAIEQIPDFLRVANEISRQSWQSRQYGLRIRDDDAEFRQLSALAEHGMLRSYVWWVDGKPAAFAVCNQHRGCFRYEEIAYCAEFGQFSPGRTMLLQIVEDLFRHDPPEYLDFGGGDAEYKQQFANRESRSGTVWLAPPTWRAGCTLSYLKACRSLRSTVRKWIKQAGWGIQARQWIRSRAATAVRATVEEPGETVQALPTTESQ